ncbi:hypothetical protein PAXRUDRAFT_22902 [Paxillus rubicundulus Ve08.2h10]|uniref:Uncharacterized protein n=1 Tax=Paxillus rubicundulus Ve08.2h10 TaxID=930991 RepID=A0A0D0C7V2_9AGAM|nr:hypothetical protein PAXRUDRAFT_22902 [Paxillus rubicundulus Ve08.2h10]
MSALEMAGSSMDSPGIFTLGIVGLRIVCLGMNGPVMSTLGFVGLRYLLLALLASGLLDLE